MTYKSSLPARLSLALFSFFILATPGAFAGEVILQDDTVLVAFDSDSGALTRLEHMTTDRSVDWTIERRPELGVSFRMFAPLPERRFNPILGQKQQAAEVKKISDNEVELQWTNLMSENGGALPITFTAHVTLTNGVLTFNSTLQNDSALTVETIDYPYLGDFNPQGRDSSLEAYTLKNDDLQSQEIYPHFSNRKGYWGVFYPIKTFDGRDNSFCLIQAPYRGVDVEMGKSSSKYLLQYTFEQHPGLISSITQEVPREDDISGATVHLEFRTCHFVFAHGHSTTELAPITLRCYNGGKDAGERIHQQSRSNR
jgi:hypothetical protein